jgi:hypothetical protein
MSLRPEPLGRGYDPPTAARHIHRLHQSLSATAHPYLQEENRVLKAQLRGRRLCLTDTERRCLAALAYPLCSRQSLRPPHSCAGLVGSSHRSSTGVNTADHLDDHVCPKRSNTSSSAWQKGIPPGGIAVSRAPVQPRLRHCCDQASEHPTPLPHRAHPPTTPGRHELGTIPETALGGSGRNRFLHGRGCLWRGFL